MKTLELSGAYGQTASLEAWKAGKDMLILTAGVKGSYCSIRDVDRLRADGFEIIEFYVARSVAFLVDLRK